MTSMRVERDEKKGRTVWNKRPSLGGRRGQRFLTHGGMTDDCPKKRELNSIRALPKHSRAIR